MPTRIDDLKEVKKKELPEESSPVDDLPEWSGEEEVAEEAPEYTIPKKEIDEFAAAQLNDLGIQEPFPDELTETYVAFKKKKDTLQSGRLTPGELVTVIFLSGITQKEKG